MVGAKAVTARARIVTGEERETVWKMMAEVYPPYLEYQERTEREIPVIVLDPVED
jgi:proline iminopeptidase